MTRRRHKVVPDSDGNHPGTAPGTASMSHDPARTVPANLGPEQGVPGPREPEPPGNRPGSEISGGISGTPGSRKGTRGCQGTTKAENQRLSEEGIHPLGEVLEEILVTLPVVTTHCNWCAFRFDVQAGQHPIVCPECGATNKFVSVEEKK